MSKRKLAEIEDSDLPEPTPATKRKPTPNKIPEHSQKKLAQFFKESGDFKIPVVTRGSASVDDFDGEAKMYTWNIAGTTVFDKGIIQQFL